MDKKRTVVIIATLDTKAPAAGYLREQIIAWGLDTILIDPGILGAPGIPADISRWQVAQAADTTLETLIAGQDVQICIAAQSEGVRSITSRLHAGGRLDGILALGGRLGSAIGAAAMHALPLGVPKLMLSTADNPLRPAAYTGAVDICVLHTPTDIRDVNAISRPILSNAANAIAGMVSRNPTTVQDDKPVIAITQSDMTSAGVKRLQGLLEMQGFQLVPFHTDGAGGAAMEGLVAAGKFVGLIDLTLHEIIDHQVGGAGGTPERLECLSQRSLPAVVSLGGCDYISFEPAGKAPDDVKHRPQMQLDDHTTAFQPTIEEVEAAAGYIARQLNRALGPTMVVVPSVGFSELNQPGRPLWFPQGNRATIEALRSELRPEVPLVLVDAHINQPVFADVIAACMARLLAGEPPESIAARYQFS